MKKIFLITILITSAISVATVSCKKENAFTYPGNKMPSKLLTDTPYRHSAVIHDTPYLPVSTSYTDTPYLRK